MCSVIAINFAKVVAGLLKDISEAFINSICHNLILLLQLLPKRLPLQPLTILVFLQSPALHLLLPLITISTTSTTTTNNDNKNTHNDI